MSDTIEPTTDPTIAAARVTAAVAVRDHAHAAVLDALDGVAGAVVAKRDPTDDEAAAVIDAACAFAAAVADLTREVCDAACYAQAGGLDEIVAAIAAGIDDVTWIAPITKAPSGDTDKLLRAIARASHVVDAARACLSEAGLTEARRIDTFMAYAEERLAPLVARAAKRRLRPMAQA